jgi:hypothetical protein
MFWQIREMRRRVCIYKMSREGDVKMSRILVDALLAFDTKG